MSETKRVMDSMMRLGWSNPVYGRKAHLVFETEGEQAIKACDSVGGFSGPLSEYRPTKACKRCLAVEQKLASAEVQS